MYRFAVLAVVASATGCAARAQQLPDATVWTVDHVAQTRWVSSAVVSPDGQYTAYVRGTPRRLEVEDDGGPHRQLFVIGPEGETRAYGSVDDGVGNVGFSADSSLLLFTGHRSSDEHRTLYAMPVDGGGARKVLEPLSGVSEYAWAPDGNRVAYLALSPEPDNPARDKGFDARVVDEQTRSTKLWIADTAPLPDVWETDPDAGDEPEPMPVDGSLSSLSWSPDGNWLLVAQAPRPGPDDHLIGRKLVIVDPVDGSIRATVDHEGKLSDTAWSPDSTQIAFIGGENLSDPAAGRLFVADLDGAVREVLPDYEGHVWTVTWRDADTIAYIGAEGTKTRWASVDLDGTRASLADDSGVVLGSVSMADGGEHAVFVAHSATHPDELYRWRAGGALERVTTTNPWMADLRFAEQETVRWPAADGLEIEGVLVHPLEPSDEPVPLIILVHGGPEAHVSEGWMTGYNRPGQVAAARGFAVLYPNYRGSTGRGVAYSRLDQGAYATPEFDDLVDGAKYLAEQGLIDIDRVGITGGSYGGYASAWGATKLSEHFAASVMFVGVSDLVSKFGTTDIPNEMIVSHAQKAPWEDWEMYWDRSPITWAGQSRTPLLILHGEDDPRVPLSQSQELYGFLKAHGNAPVRLVVYPGEGHGNHRAASRYDYHLRSLRWMEHYLMGEGGDAPPYELDYGLGGDEEDDAADE